MPRERNCLIISDSRFRNVAPAPVDGWSITLWCEGGMRLSRLIEVVNEKLTAETDLLVLVGFLCDLSYRMERPDRSKGLLRSHVTPPLDAIYNKVSANTTLWERRFNVSIVWTLPHEVKVYRYNDMIARQCKQKRGLNSLQGEEAWQDAKVLKKSLKALQNKFKEHKMPLYDLAKTEFDLKHDYCDGVHLEKSNRKHVLDQLVVAATASYPFAVPPVKGKLKDEAGKARRAMKRKRNRQNRKANKALAAVEENVQYEEPPAKIRYREQHPHRPEFVLGGRNDIGHPRPMSGQHYSRVWHSPSRRY